MKLTKEFYSRDTITVSKELLGKNLVRVINGKKVKGKIVETEAYLGLIDKASHAYGGKITKRVKPLYGQPGIAYVFSIYGMYQCFNIITKEVGEPEGVLIRALEPVEGLDIIANNRYSKEYEGLTKKEKKNLTNGPSKLCIAMDIDKNRHNFMDLLNSEELYIEEYLEIPMEDVEERPRVGIDYAEEAAAFLWRFYIKENEFISKK